MLEEVAGIDAMIDSLGGVVVHGRWGRSSGR
jgi:hypothetical protein